MNFLLLVLVSYWLLQCENVIFDLFYMVVNWMFWSFGLLVLMVSQLWFIQTFTVLEKRRSACSQFISSAYTLFLCFWIKKGRHSATGWEIRSSGNKKPRVELEIKPCGVNGPPAWPLQIIIRSQVSWFHYQQTPSSQRRAWIHIHTLYILLSHTRHYYSLY